MTTAWPLPTRLTGVLRRPRATFEALAAAPRALDVLTLGFVAAFAATALALETDIGELALLDQLERTVSAFGEPLDEAQYAALQEISDRGTAYALVTSFVSIPLLAVGVSGVLVGWRRARSRTAGPAPSFRQVLAVAGHASIILALRQMLAAPLVYARETMASPLTLTMFFTLLDEGSPLTRFVGMIDLFVIWWTIVLAIGVSVLYRLRMARVVAVFAGAYLVVAALLATVVAITGGAA